MHMSPRSLEYRLHDEPAGHAVVVDGLLCIAVPVEYLPTIVEGALGCPMRLRVVDADLCAEELCHYLNEEDEEGTTPVHRMFDAAIWRAYEYGAEGIEKHPDQEGV